jgi:23S rRNA pseudouridine1911/1915/1917 synthase
LNHGLEALVEQRPLSKTNFDYDPALMTQPPKNALETSANKPLADLEINPDSSTEIESETPDAELPEQRQSQVTAQLHGQRLDKAVVTLAREFSRNYLQSLIEQGHVYVDGVAVTSASRKVKLGELLTIDLVPTAESRSFQPESLPINVVFEDEHVMVVNKAAGMVVHPAAGNWSGTLLNALLAHHATAASLPRAGIVHRLDKDTSGLMVVGKTLIAVTALTRAIAAREVHRQYLAIAQGVVHPAAFSIEAPVGRDPKSRIRMAVVSSGKAARTDVQVVTCSQGFSALRCTLHSGRTHQIRVHLADRGHALVADALYGGRPALAMERQALHATKLAFAHPASGENLSFEAAAPKDFLNAWDSVTLPS